MIDHTYQNKQFKVGDRFRVNNYLKDDIVVDLNAYGNRTYRVQYLHDTHLTALYNGYQSVFRYDDWVLEKIEGDTMSRILFTGCSTGFGKYIRQQLLDQGHKVYGVGLHGPDHNIDFLDESMRVGSLASNCQNIIDCAAAEMGGLDTLINNAGITHIEFMPGHEMQKFMEVMHVNLFVPFALSKAFVARVQSLTKTTDLIADTHNGRWSLIHTSSQGARQALRGSPGYCASKAGLEAMSRTFAREFAGKLPITSVVVAPGGVDGTEMMKGVVKSLMQTRGMTEEEATAYTRPSPLGRNCEYEELWKVYDFAINQCPEYMSGTVLQMSGAMGI